MKKFYYLFLLLSVFSYSQEVFTFKNGGGVLENEKKFHQQKSEKSLVIDKI